MVLEQRNDESIVQGSECSSDHKQNLWGQVAQNQILALPFTGYIWLGKVQHLSKPLLPRL